MEAREGDEKRDRALLAGLRVRARRQGDARRRSLWRRRSPPILGPRQRHEPRSPFRPSERVGILEAFGVERRGRADERPASAGSSAIGGGDGSDPESYSRLLKESYEKAPALPFAAWLAERRARARGESTTSSNGCESGDRRPRTGSSKPTTSYARRAHSPIRGPRAGQRNFSSKRPCRARPTSPCANCTNACPLRRPGSGDVLGRKGNRRNRSGPRQARALRAFEFERVGNFAEAARLAQISLEVRGQRAGAHSVQSERGQRGTCLEPRRAAFRAGASSEDVHLRVEA